MRNRVRLTAFVVVLCAVPMMFARAAEDDLVFLHHSVGANWLDSGLDSVLVEKDYIDERNDITYGTDVTPDAGRPDSLADIPGDQTDMCHWVKWFNDYFDSMVHHDCTDGINRIIMFKSCYPASDVSDTGSEPGDPFSIDQTLANYRAIFRHPGGVGGTYTNEGTVYKSLEETFAAHPEILFIPVVSTPEHQGTSTDADAHRARLHSIWMTNTWLTSYNERNPGLHNVAVFNWFNLLANADNAAASPNRLKTSYGGTSGDSHPNSTANQQSTIVFATQPGNFLDLAWTAFTNAQTAVPTVTITNPTSGSSWSTTNATIDLAGDATDDVGVLSVTWTNETTAAGGTCTGTGPWRQDGITLQPGINAIAVMAKDAATNTASDSLTVFYSNLLITKPDSGTLVITGESMDITWTSDIALGTVDVRLLQDTNCISILANSMASPTAAMTWKCLLPTNVSAATGYRIEVAGSGAVGYSTNFSILSGRRPYVQWNRTEGATWYYLWISRNGASYYTKWLNQPGTAWNAVTDYPAGNYAAWIQPYIPGVGRGAWQGPFAFVVPSMIPVATTPLSPAGTITTNRPVFAWSAVDYAKWYYLWISRSNVTHTRTWIAAPATNYTPTANLRYGNYRWWVRTWSPDGYGPWSTTGDFYIPAAVPVIITLVTPDGTATAGSVDYIWDADPKATWYQLWITRNGTRWFTQWYSTGVTAGQITRSIPGHTAGASYTWWVRGWAADGTGPWSASKSFTAN